MARKTSKAPAPVPKDPLASPDKLKHGYGERPTKSKNEFCDQLIAYFTRSGAYHRMMTMFGPKEDPFDLPTLAGFAIQIGVHRDTLHE